MRERFNMRNQRNQREKIWLHFFPAERRFPQRKISLFSVLRDDKSILLPQAIHFPEELIASTISGNDPH